MLNLALSLRWDLCYRGATLVTDDARLLVQAKRLEPQALTEIHNRHYPDLYRYLLYRTSDERVAEDLASDVFVRLLDVLHAGKAPDNLRPWLFGVASHLVADHFRKQLRHPQVTLSDELPSTENDLDTEAHLSLATDELRVALQHLTNEQQQVLALRFGKAYSINDTATLMQKSVSMVKQLQFRAVAALRRQLEAWR